MKILEEPPEFTTIILVTDHKKLLFETIISRCQEIAIPALQDDYIFNWLTERDIKGISLALNKSINREVERFSKRLEFSKVENIKNPSHFKILVHNSCQGTKCVQENVGDVPSSSHYPYALFFLVRTFGIFLLEIFNQTATAVRERNKTRTFQFPKHFRTIVSRL